MGGSGLKLYPCSSQAFTDHSVRRSGQFSFVLLFLFDPGQVPSNGIMFYHIPSCSISGCVSRPTWLESQLIRILSSPPPSPPSHLNQPSVTCLCRHVGQFTYHVSWLTNRVCKLLTNRASTGEGRGGGEGGGTASPKFVSHWEKLVQW